MKTPRTIITIAAIALFAHATAVAQPTKFLAAHERGTEDRPALIVNAPESASVVRHQHRPGAGSPRTVRAVSAETPERATAAPAAAEERQVRVGPRSKSRDFVRPSDTSAVHAAPAESPRRAAGPPARTRGRR